MKHARLCLLLILALASTALVAQSDPVPLLYQLSPASGKPGHAAFTMRIHGTGFVSGAIASWNGTALTTKFISQSTVAARVPATFLATSNTASITVANPAGISSNVVYFPVHRSSTTVAYTMGSKTLEYGAPGVGDYTNDGNPDISILGSGSNQTGYFDAFLGNGHGAFGKVSDVLYSSFDLVLCGPSIAGDFNNDGILDVAACAGSSDGNVPAGYYIYLGNGHGGFTQVGTLLGVIGAGAAADMNGDGILDFVGIGASGGPANLYVSLGNGDGTFTIVSSPDIFGFYPIVGDFNGDGKLDVAVPNSTYVAVFLGNGDGTLQSEVDYPTSGGAVNSGFQAAAIDLNGDGKLDIVTNNGCVLLGNGDGTFVNTFSMPVNGRNGGLLVADLNGDGKLDLATPASNSSNQSTLDILLGNGDGTFQTPLSFVVSNFEFGDLPTAMADFNSDGALDFVVGGLPSTVLMYQTAPK